MMSLLCPKPWLLLIFFAALQESVQLCDVEMHPSFAEYGYQHKYCPGGKLKTSFASSQNFLARVESFGFFDDCDCDWARRRKLHFKQNFRQTEKNHSFDGEAFTLGRSYFQKMWEPSLHCTFAERIGVMGDGGKWICDPHRIPKKQCLVYSVGSNKEVEFEEVLSRCLKWWTASLYHMHVHLIVWNTDSDLVPYTDLNLSPYPDPDPDHDSRGHCRIRHSSRIKIRQEQH
eukprot:gb/GEZN01013743.1/.p1 GENE.gb/GEZN01013743.1/~~gb/GEZN01013743.1/.p1  ORF type:complete len:230 (+),score=14.79 gb/GEZN01013743.1/:209-898(+)